MEPFKRDKRGRVIKDSAFFSAIGQKGGEENKRRAIEKNPNHFSEIGLAGGRKMLETKGKKFYSDIGKLKAKKGKQPWKNN